MPDRHEVFEGCKRRLQHLAWRAENVFSFKKDQYYIICIDRDDEVWSDLADALMPNHDWQQYRNMGARPIAQGIVSRDNPATTYLKDVIPFIVPGFEKNLNGALAIICADGGASAYEIHPREDNGENPTYYWLSFVNPDSPQGPQFLGVAIVEAENFIEAVMTAARKNIHPGGEVTGTPIPDIAMTYIGPQWIERVLSRAEAMQLKNELKVFNDVIEEKKRSKILN